MEERLSTPPAIFALWYGVLAGPIAFMAQMQVKYMLVPWACSIGSQSWLHLVTLIALIFPISAGVIAWRMRTHAMGVAGMMMSGMFLLAMIAQDIPTFLLGACQ